MPDHKQTEGSVPSDTNYENFMKATNKSTVFILAFMNFLMAMNRKKMFWNKWKKRESNLKLLQEKIWTDLWAALNVIISSIEASLNSTGKHWKITFSLNIIRHELLSVCSGTFSIALQLVWLTAIWIFIKTFSDYG